MNEFEANLYFEEKPVEDKIIYTILLAASLFILEILLIWLSPLPVFILFHLLLSLAAIGYVFFFKKKEWELRFPILCALFFITMGPLGSFFSLLILLLYLVFYRFSPPTSELLESLFPQFYQEKRDILYERLVYGIEDVTKEGGAIAFQDIMAFGNEKQKRNTIEKILKYFHPEFFPALFMALNDASNSVRVHAATAITSLDSRFFEYYLELKRAVELHPDNPKLVLSLAQHCAMYAHSRILDPQREKKMREEAIHAYLAYAKFYPEEQKVHLELAKLYLASKQPKLAKQQLEPAMMVGKLLPSEYYLVWMKILFENQDFSALRYISGQIPLSLLDPKESSFDKLKQLVLLWQNKVEMQPENV